MYEQFYGFKIKPFELLPDPRFLYLSEKHDLAYAHLEYGITDNKGFIVLTGDVGAGKTTLINYFLRKIKSDVNTALLYNTNIDPTTFLDMVIKDFGVPIEGKTRRSGLYEKLYKFLLHEHVQGRRCVLIIDEAQNMPDETLEELRMLSNFETEETYLLQIIMAGQPQLRERLNDPALAQLTQRISVYYHLAPLDKNESHKYIDHRLNISGYSSSEPLFTDKAINSIFEYTKGVPRLISSVCDTALMYGYAEDQKTIDDALIERVKKNREISDNKNQDETKEATKPRPDKTQPSVDRSKTGVNTILSQLSKFDERLTKIEAELQKLERIRNQQIVSELFEWFKSVQQENTNLRKQLQDTSSSSNSSGGNIKTKNNTQAKNDDTVPFPRKAVQS